MLAGNADEPSSCEDQIKDLLELIPRLLRLVQRAELLMDQAERTLGRADQLIERTEKLLDQVEEVAPAALPILGKTLEAVDPEEVRAVNGLVDQLPSLVEQLKDVGPNVRAILQSVDDLSEGLRGLPGVGSLFRRDDE